MFCQYSGHYFLPIAAKSNQKTPQEEMEVAIPPFPLDSYPTQTPTWSPLIAVRTGILFPHCFYEFACKLAEWGDS